MIPTSGLPANFTLKLIERSRDKFEDAIERDPINKREITAFRERISSITTVDALVDDYEVYSFVMKAFDLESQIYGKAMMKKVLSSTKGEKGALIDKMTDPRFKELYSAMGFTEGGKANETTSDPDWINSMVQRYVDQKLVNDQLDTNSVVGTALHAQGKVPQLSSWYTVLADTKLQDFFYTALNLPDTMKTADIDAQAEMLKKKLDLEKVKDPKELERLVTRYVAIAEAKAAQANLASNPILQLFSNNSNGTRAITSINLDGLSTLKSNRY